LLLPFLWIILIHLPVALRASLIDFSHLSQFLLASLSFTSLPSFISFCAFLSWFSHLFSLFLAPLSVASRIFSVDHHIRSYVSHISPCCFSHISIAYCIFLMCFWHLFHMLILFNLLLLTRSFTSHTFSTWFFYLF
jgi:hypothetical protein